MPLKACERYIFHVKVYAFFSEMPKSRTLSVSFSFLFEFSSRAFFWHARFSFVRLFWNAQFSINSGRNLLNLFKKCFTLDLACRKKSASVAKSIYGILTSWLYDWSWRHARSWVELSYCKSRFVIRIISLSPIFPKNTQVLNFVNWKNRRKWKDL